MMERLNDGLRRLIGLLIDLSGIAFGAWHRLRITSFALSQQRLRERYGITAETPVLNYGPEIEQLIEGAAARQGRARYAETSGSTASPKRILYTERRLRSVRWTFIDVFCRCCRAYGIRRQSLYVLGAFGKDNSLTSMLLEEKHLPSYLVTLQAPYRVERHPAIQDLVKQYGSTAVRLWILTIANPGVLYSTNPSTLWLFLNEVATDWDRSRRLIRDFQSNPRAFNSAIHRIADRLRSQGTTGRLACLASSDRPLPLTVYAPSVRAYICWTGGYVQPFLDRIEKHLPPERYRLIPMYSMSTETIETINHFERRTIAFLPLGPRVLYEFVEEGVADPPRNLRTPDQLKAMQSYFMVVSDAFGLRRYQTEDVFLCNGFVRGLPDLRFLRRRNLEYSFTGEKVSSEQINLVFQKLREEDETIGLHGFLTCIPSQPRDEPFPHYKLALVGETGRAALADRCDLLLQQVNAEYRNKRRDGRLGAMRFVSLSFDNFIRAAPEAQFKFLPLYRRTWEEMMGTEPHALSNT